MLQNHFKVNLMNIKELLNLKELSLELQSKP